MEAYSYLCIGGPAHGRYYASPNPGRLKVFESPPLTATFFKAEDIWDVVGGPLVREFEYTARKFTILGKVTALWTDPEQSDWAVLEGLKFYLLERFVSGEIR